MQKLHLVGFTTDQDGLILSARRNARSGGYLLALDDALARAVDDFRARQAEEAEARGTAARSDRVESRLPVSDMQSRLRRGRSVKEVAKEAGVEPEWVERFAVPVFSEMAQVISRVRNTPLTRQRLGPSAMRIGDAVRRNLAERGVVMTPGDFDSAWTTHQRPDGRWLVKFTFHYRGSNRTLRFDVSEPSGAIAAGDSLTGQLAYIAPTVRRSSRPTPTKAQVESDAAKRATVGQGFRAEARPSKAVSRPARERDRAAAAMAKAASKRAAEAERSAARKAKERAAQLARQEREARAEAIRRERERTAELRAASAAARAEAQAQAESDRVAAAAAAARQKERDAARRAAREEAAAKSAKRPAKRAGKATKASKAPARSGSTKAAGSSRKGSGAAKSTGRKAPSGGGAATSRTSPARGSSPARADAAPKSTGDRLASSSPSAPTRTDAPTQPVPVVGARTSGDGDAGSRPRPASPPRPEERVDAPAPARRRPSPPSAQADRPVRRESPEARQSSGLSGAAVDVYGPEATRALFRAGLVEQASNARPAPDSAAAGRTSRDDVPATPRSTPDAEPNGTEGRPRQRPPGARRTRPLRAT